MRLRYEAMRDAPTWRTLSTVGRYSTLITFIAIIIIIAPTKKLRAQSGMSIDVLKNRVERDPRIIVIIPAEKRVRLG
jgi:hypothetical protein